MTIARVSARFWVTAAAATFHGARAHSRDVARGCRRRRRRLALSLIISSARGRGTYQEFLLGSVGGGCDTAGEARAGTLWGTGFESCPFRNSYCQPPKRAKKSRGSRAQALSVA